MSLATRCTACGTIFRIVEDQLRVSDGWVRCGRCAEVFDARELLFDIERDAPPAWPVQFTASSAVSPEPEAMADDEPPAAMPPPAPAPAPVSAPPEPVFEAPRESLPEPTYDAAADFADDALADGRQEPRWVDSPPLPPPAPIPPPPPPPAPPSPVVAAPVVPDFVRRAQADERWKRPGVQWALRGVAALLMAGLALQATVHFRDACAALYPATRPLLAALCQPFQCTVSPWRRADVLDIESTALTQLGTRNAYKLAVAVRNKSGTEVAAPWIELSVTDSAGTLVARRALPPASLTPAIDHLGPDSEQSLTVSFATGSQRVNGYTVNVFQP